MRCRLYEPCLHFSSHGRGQLFSDYDDHTLHLQIQQPVDSLGKRFQDLALHEPFAKSINKDMAITDVCLFRYQFERQINRQLRLVKVGHIIHKRQWRSRMDISDTGRVSQRQKRRYAHSVKELIHKRQRPIDRIALRRLAWHVGPPQPFNSVFLGQVSIQSANSDALHTHHRLQAFAFQVIRREPKRKHPPCHFYTSDRIKCQSRLPI